MNFEKNHFIKKIFATVLAIVIAVLSLSSCTTKVKTSVSAASEINEAAYSARNNHITNTNSLIYVAKSGLLELYFDRTTYNVAIKDTSTNKTWYALPVASDGDETTPAAVLEMILSSEGGKYKLNSQDNSVAFSSASFKPVNNGIQVTYNMALTAENALKAYNEVGNGEIYASVSVTFSLADGAFYAKINSGDITVSKGYVIEKLELLNYFGASTVAESDDYIFVPDASGALIMTGSGATDNYESRSYSVYGKDKALKQASADEISADAIMPVFGMKSSQNAFLGIVLSGDTVADITSHRKVYNEGGTYNRVGASFRITDVSYITNSTGKKTTRYVGETYTGEINICYRFLSGKNAVYSGLASACREVLIRESVIPSKVAESTDHIPLMLTVQGAIAKNSAHSYKTLSDYEQTLDLLGQLKAKGVNSITLRYKGMLDGADNQDEISSASPIKSLGSKKDFAALEQYVKTQKFTMFTDLSLVNYNKKGSSSSAAYDITGEKLRTDYSNIYSSVAGKENRTRYALNLSKLEDGVLSFIKNNKNYQVDGYSINDVGSSLYSDYSGEKHTRSNAVNIITSQLSVLGNNHQMMIENGNFCMLSNANAVVNLPTKTAYEEDGAVYKAIPFAQIVLHGIVDYSNEPINLSENSKQAFLKSIEYGAMPSYEWTYAKTDNEEFDAKYNYESQITQAADNYTFADNTIGNLRSARITNHYQIQNGVYCTEYNNSIVIYFNYNSEAVTVNSITVEPMSCIRAN